MSKSTFSGPVQSDAGFIAGDGNVQVKAILAAKNAALDFGSIAATTKGSKTITVTGAAVGDPVLVSLRTALEDDIVLSEAIVTGANTVTVYAYNPTAGAINPAAITADVLVFDIT